MQGIDEHLSTGAAECTVCPLCRMVHTVRQLNPEAMTHLASAAVSLAQAVAALLSTPTQHHAAGGVEDIPVDDDWPDESDQL